ncbi:aminotransferase class IV [Conexibacter sp. DBS9H8]|uniref:aminotransferase class IV n=1 Tax=Conexibacter sp. DBS9H8 TaxID=2937801 RepID=UPI00200CD70F|nr:aminotransferase class IV [Conexibacter sp. DBS9H8]
MSATEGSLASLDGTIAPAAETLIPVTDEGLIRGDGIFEVIRLYDGRPFRLEAHLDRLERSGAGIRLPVDRATITSEVTELLAAAGSGPAHQAVRIMLTRGGRRIILTEAMHHIPPVTRLATVTYAPTRVLDNIKSLSYAANMLMGRLAREQGADEALAVTPHGRVLEAPTSSIFWVTDGAVHTPPLSEHILASITRAFVIEVIAATGIAGGQVTEAPVGLAELLGADETFLTSTLREVQPVSAIDTTTFPAPGPVTAEVAAAVRAEIDRWRSAADPAA